MPKLNEVKPSNEIGYKDKGDKYIWHRAIHWSRIKKQKSGKVLSGSNAVNPVFIF